MNSLSTTITDTNPIELWRLIRQEWYYIEDEEILLLPDCLDLRKDMQPPETCISFNEGKGTSHYQKMFQVMADLFLKMTMKEEHLFAGLVDEEVCNKINKRENLIEFKRDRGENNSHFGLYYLTDDEEKILAVKSRLINILEKNLTNIIGEDNNLADELKSLKARRKNIEKEVKRLKILVKNQVENHCTKSGIKDIEIEINENGYITLKKYNLDEENYCELNSSISEISPLTLTKYDDFPEDINIVLSVINTVKISK